MEHKSPYDVIPAELVHRPEALTATADALGLLTEFVYPLAVDVLRSAAARQTGSASAAVLDEEARQVLMQLLEEPDTADEHLSDDDDEQDKLLRLSLAQAVEAEARRSLGDDVPAWLEMRGRDLARASATIWLELAQDETTQVHGIEMLLQGQMEPQQSSIAQLEKRFDLSQQEIGTLLRSIQEVARPSMIESATVESFEEPQYLERS